MGLFDRKASSDRKSRKEPERHLFGRKSRTVGIPFPQRLNGTVLGSSGQFWEEGSGTFLSGPVRIVALLL